MSQESPLFGLNFIAHASANTGLGNLARQFISSFVERGINIRIFDLDAGQRSNFDNRWSHLTVEHAKELPYAVNLSIISALDLSNYGLNPPKGLQINGRLNVVFPWWELSDIPKHWPDACRVFDALIAGSNFNYNTFSTHVSGMPILLAPCPVNLPSVVIPNRKRFKLPEDALLVYTGFEPFSDPVRKNPFSSVEAFMRAFPENDDCHLVIKINNGNDPHLKGKNLKLLENLRASVSSEPRIHLINESLPYDQLLSLYASCDIFISLHRSEGLGMVPLEAMRLGKPVVATAWSGNMHYMNYMNSCPVSYDFTGTGDSTYYSKKTLGINAFWAEPNVNQAAAWLQKLAEDSQFRSQLGLRAAVDAKQYHEQARRVEFVDELKAIWESSAFLPKRDREILIDKARDSTRRFNMASNPGIQQNHFNLMKSFFKKIVKKTAVLSINYFNRSPLLHAPFIKIVKKLGLELHLFKPYIGMQAAALKYLMWSTCFDTPNTETKHRLITSTHTDSLVFVIAHFDETSEKYAEKLANQLFGSLGQHWRAVFQFSPTCLSASTIIENIRRTSDADSRIVFNNKEIETDAEFIVLIQGGAMPRPHALRIFTDALRSEAKALFAYSDEDQLHSDTSICNAWFKPRFSPLLARQGMLLGRMLAFRSAGNTEHKLLLNQLLTTSKDSATYARNYALDIGETRIIHIPHVLFHDAMTDCEQFPINYSLPKILPVVSIVIPTRDRWDLLGPCLDSLKNTNWPKECLEIIVIDNGSKDPTLLQELTKAKDNYLIKVIRDDMQFNWSRLNNLAARQSSGELLVFLNNDTVLLDNLWLKKMVFHALDPNAGAVGCKLLYPDFTVQHGGVILGINGLAAHAHLNIPSNKGGYHGLANTTHEVTAVTGACLAVSRENFDLVGGFDENFRVAFNDIAFCCALHMLGKRNVYVADALFIHLESKTRGCDDTKEKQLLVKYEGAMLAALFEELIGDDPFYSPNLSLSSPYQLESAPRRQPFWDQSHK